MHKENFFIWYFCYLLERRIRTKENPKQYDFRIFYSKLYICLVSMQIQVAILLSILQSWGIGSTVTCIFNR